MTRRATSDPQRRPARRPGPLPAAQHGRPRSGGTSPTLPASAPGDEAAAQTSTAGLHPGARTTPAQSAGFERAPPDICLVRDPEEIAAQRSRRSWPNLDNPNFESFGGRRDFSGDRPDNVDKRFIVR